jgi:acyl carrier protein
MNDTLSPADPREFILATIAKACNLERAVVTCQTSMQDLGMDSLSFFSIINHIGMVYGIDLVPDEITDLFRAASVGELVAFFENAIAASGQSTGIPDPYVI